MAYTPHVTQRASHSGTYFGRNARRALWADIGAAEAGDHVGAVPEGPGVDDGVAGVVVDVQHRRQVHVHREQSRCFFTTFSPVNDHSCMTVHEPYSLVVP